MLLPNLLKGLRVSLKDNGSAYAFSISITGSYAVLTTIQPKSNLVDLFAGAAGAVSAFAVIQGGMFLFMRNIEEGEIEQTRLLARLMSILSVGGSMAAAVACGLTLHHALAWFAGIFSSSVVFIVLDAIQLAIVKESKNDPAN